MASGLGDPKRKQRILIEVAALVATAFIAGSSTGSPAVLGAIGGSAAVVLIIVEMALTLRRRRRFASRLQAPGRK